MPKIYTKTGDSGITSLYDGSRISKANILFNILGENDELSARIGLLIAKLNKSKINNDYMIMVLRNVQKVIQLINSHVATSDKIKRDRLSEIDNSDIEELETYIDDIQNELPKLTKFILPGVTDVDAQAHLCRTQARKTERMLWTLYEENEEDDSNILSLNIFVFMNRLSDFFFVAARMICKQLGKEDEFA